MPHDRKDVRRSISDRLRQFVAMLSNQFSKPSAELLKQAEERVTEQLPEKPPGNV